MNKMCELVEPIKNMIRDASERIKLKIQKKYFCFCSSTSSSAINYSQKMNEKLILQKAFDE